MGEASGNIVATTVASIESTAAHSRETALVDIDRHVRAGLLVILVGFVGVLVWAALAPLAAAVVAPGQLVPEGNRKTIQHLEGGIIQSIRVKEGDVVKAGDVLIQLDSVATRARSTALTSQLASLRATEARLQAEERSLDAIPFPPDLLERRNEPEIADLLQGQREIFRARSEAKRLRLASLNGEINQLREQIKGLEAQRVAALAQLASVNDELAGLRRLYKEGFGWESRMRAFDREGQKLQGDAAKASAEKAAASARIQQVLAEIAKTDQEYLEKVAEQRHDTVRQIHDIEQQASAALDSLKRLDVVAPYPGRVLNPSKHAVNGVVAPGEALMDIVPAGERLIADVRIGPQDIDQVQTGQKADVLFPTLNRRQTPSLAGEVEVVSADRLVDSATNQPYYLARVRITETDPAKLNSVLFQPGIPVEVHVQTGARTALSYLLKPLTDSIKRGMTET